MLRKTLPVVFGMVALLAAVCSVLAYPTPSSVPVRWELHFIPGELRLYHHEPSDRHYWYFTYMVENRTGRDQTWAPQFTLFTDAGEILPSGEGVPMEVTRSILSMLGNELLMNQYEVIGELLQGREHAKEGLVVWPARNLNITELSMFISGISGETRRVTDPLTGEEFLFRKTLQRDYTVPGDPAARGSRPIELASQRWILR
jgi:hypothetical protein